MLACFLSIYADVDGRQNRALVFKENHLAEGATTQETLRQKGP